MKKIDPLSFQVISSVTYTSHQNYVKIASYTDSGQGAGLISNTPLLATKLYRPPVAEGFVKREHLESRLESGVNLPLTVVSAPAGYGKSSLLSRWMEISDLPGAWLSLDESDSDLRVFLHYLVAAIRTKIPDGCNETLALLKGDSLPPVKDIAIYLGNDLHGLGKRIVLVLDDYHQISEPDIHQLLDLLLKHPPRNLHLVLASRHDPPLSLAGLRVRHFLNEFRMQDLEFSTEDTSTFFMQAVGRELNPEALQRLQDKLEGWPVGVRLAALALRSHEDPEAVLKRFGADNRPLQQYLVFEVLHGLSKVDRECLLRISILKRFNVSLCEAIWHNDVDTGPEFGKKFVQTLEETGLFCLPLDGQRNWYRFHHLFKDLLKQYLQDNHDKEEIRQLNVRASHWFLSHGHFEEGVHHALAASDEEGAASIVGRARHDLMNREEWHRLERWLKLFTDNLIIEQPQLLLLRCWLSLYHWYRLDLLIKDLARVEPLISSKIQDTHEAKLLLAEVASLKTAMAYWTLQVAETVELSNKVLQVTPKEHECVQDCTLMHRIGVQQMLGELSAGESLLRDYTASENSRSPGSMGRLLQSLCFVYWRNGDVRKLIQTAEQLLQISTTNDQAWSLSFARYFIGLVHYERNELDRAVEQLQQVCAHPYRFPIQNVTHCSILLSLCHQAMGKTEDAREVAESVTRLTLERGNSPFIDLARAFQAEIDLLQGRITQATQWAGSFPEKLSPANAMQRYFNAELTLSRIQLFHGNETEKKYASDRLDALYQNLVQSRHQRLLIDVLGLRALVADSNGEEESAVSYLNEALSMAQPGRLVRPLIDLGPGLVKLLSRLKLEGESLKFAGTVMAAFQQADHSEAASAQNQGLMEPLSERELDVLKLVAQSLSNKDIAEKLFISPGTVKRHAHNIYGKLAVNSRRDAVTKALGLGLIQS